MPQFFIDNTKISNGFGVISGADAKHITKVLRLQIGDWLMITDGKGARYKAVIVEAGSKDVKVKLDSAPVKQRDTAQVTLAQALVKHDKFEWIIQKSVELGCSRIIPFSSERTVPKISDAAAKLKRWQKIADEAAKQCGTLIRPVIDAPISFREMLKKASDIEQRILFYEGESKANLRTHTLTHLRTLIMIGPEGGFASEEVEKALSSGFVSCGLGPLILRVETAAIAGLTLVQNELGYF